MKSFLYILNLRKILLLKVHFLILDLNSLFLILLAYFTNCQNLNLIWDIHFLPPFLLSINHLLPFTSDSINLLNLKLRVKVLNA
jgi:hypothetical protein